MKLKTNKTISKRFRVTKNKKLMKRHEGQDHFNARDTGNQTRRKRRDKQMSMAHKDAFKAGLPYAGL